MTIGISCSTPRFSSSYSDILNKIGTKNIFITPDDIDQVEDIIDNIDGLLLSGGPDVHPSRYGAEFTIEKGEESSGDIYPNYNQMRDELELRLFAIALSRDMPILGVCRGMQLMNVALGGSLLQTVDEHRNTSHGADETESSFHRIFISPGSRLAATVGSGGFVRVNSRHGQGIKEHNKSPDLMTSAWSLEDGVIEALESPDHEYVLGVQFHPERRGEIPPHFDKLFQNLISRSKSTI